MVDFFYRTEDIKPTEVLNYFVETAQDRRIVELLKARNPVILVGSRGVGKSFLLRVAESELIETIRTDRVAPVYVSFTRSSLLSTRDPEQFKHWMIAKLSTAVLRSFRKLGLLGSLPKSLGILAAQAVLPPTMEKLRIEEIVDKFETSWQRPREDVDVSGLPSVDEFRDAIEDLCEMVGLERVCLFIDEAAHILLPRQQREFFTLFRDLRSPYLTCNAAVYPGVTAYGEVFEPSHDATMVTIERDVLAADYVSSMREIVEKQAPSETVKNITKNGLNFALLAYAASGNPRILLKTVGRTPKVNSSEVNEVIREYYRTEVWSDHSGLVDRYGGHRELIDWGRSFIEDEVLPALQQKNNQYLSADKKTTCYFWVHRDAPEAVKEALRLLSYTGIVTEHAAGIKVTRSEIGVRYSVNLGCLFALEQVPTSTGFEIAKNLTPKRMTEYGKNHPAYTNIQEFVPRVEEFDSSDILRHQLAKDISVLDVTTWQMEALRSIGLATVGSVLEASEEKLMEAYYVGEVRSRRMRNAAIAAVFEYLSG